MKQRQTGANAHQKCHPFVRAICREIDDLSTVLLSQGHGQKRVRPVHAQAVHLVFGAVAHVHCGKAAKAQTQHTRAKAVSSHTCVGNQIIQLAQGMGQTRNRGLGQACPLGKIAIGQR